MPLQFPFSSFIKPGSQSVIIPPLAKLYFKFILGYRLNDHFYDAIMTSLEASKKSRSAQNSRGGYHYHGDTASKILFDDFISICCKIQVLKFQKNY